MQEVSIDIDVICNWTGIPPAYRLYVDNDLLTERTFIWGDSYIKEHIIVNLDKGVHTLIIQPVDPAFRGFSTRNLTIDKQASALVNNQFTIQ